MHQPVKLRDHLPVSMDQSYSSQTEIRADNMHYSNLIASVVCPGWRVLTCLFALSSLLPTQVIWSSQGNNFLY